MRSSDDLSFPALSSVDNVGYSALNIARDVLTGPISIQAVYELALVSACRNANNDAFWRNWLELHSVSLRRLETISFRLASHYFSCQLPEEVKDEIDRLPLATKMWFQECGDSPFAASFRPNKDSLWMHLSLIESDRDKRKTLIKWLCPLQLPLLEAPYIQNNLGDGEMRIGPLRKRLRYSAYVSSRIYFHIRILPRTLWRGARLWWSTMELGRDFITFLAVSVLFNLGMYIFFLLYNLYLVDRGYRENVLGM